MDKQHAKLILGFNHDLELDKDILIDCFEEAVFKQVTFFVQRPFLPMLAQKCINKLHDIHLAGKALDLNYDLLTVDKSISSELLNHNDLISLLSDYHLVESRLKSKIVNNLLPLQAIEFYNQWIIVFESFAQKYIELFDGLNVYCLVHKRDIRISQSIEYTDLFKELKELKFDNLASQEYYRLQKVMNQAEK